MNEYVFSVILSIVVLIVALGSNYIKGLLSKVSTLTPIASNTILKTWATDFISYVATWFDNYTGGEKMNWVVSQLSTLTKNSGLTITDEQLRTLAQNVYDTLKSNGTIEKLESGE